MVSRQAASLYIHIPLCTRKCDYCHFYVVPNKESFRSLLLEGLHWEWQQYVERFKNRKIVSVYFGGGTPSLFGPERIRSLLSEIQIDNCEVTLEANPENMTLELIQGYKEAGINRISIGIQSLQDSHLQTLTRQHNAAKAIKSVELARQAGINNISIDLMYDLPGQTLSEWRDTLLRAADMPITHLSLYNLTIEPHTVFFKHKEKIRSKIPKEEVSAAMYQSAIDILTQEGLHPYEISAFCRDNCVSIHNSGYWTDREFIGLGPSAFSYWERSRFRNIARLHQWHERLSKQESPIDYTEKLSYEAHEREKLAIRLRLKEGADLNSFQLDTETELAIETLIKQGLLAKKKNKLFLTDRGVLFYDTVAVEII